MSQLKLSTGLVQQLLDVLENHDSAAADQHVASQYLCAIVGFLIGQHNMPANQRDETISELAEFIRHVADDVQSQQQKQQPAPPPQEAFGIWKPKS
ncbi:MAG: hypothetical protein KTR33_02295 [Gammaproteobacteria bacterium]|nr:hypothetical protein [Gammaproteobacteria bacterium]